MVPNQPLRQTQITGAFGSRTVARTPSTLSPGTPPVETNRQQQLRGRRTRAELSSSDPEEIRNDPAQLIRDTDAARVFLWEKEMVAPGVEMTLDVLADVLLGITLLKGIAGCKTTEAALRSVAFILKEVDHDNKTDRIAEAVAEKMDTKFDEFMTEMLKSADKLTEGVTEIVDSAKNSMQDVADAVQEATTAMEGASGSYKEALLKGVSVAQTQKSFVGTTTIDPRLRAREGIRLRQILIDLDSTSGASILRACSNVSLIEAANKAIGTLDGGALHKVVGASRLKNGGILLETDSTETAVWLRDLSRREIFVMALDPGATFKSRLYPTIAQFVPITFMPDNQSELHEIEDNNAMARGSIAVARWIKPPNRRQANQAMAHLAIRYTSPEAANKALLNGIFICGTRITSIKGKREPLRCLKCHGWDHMAGACTKPDACGTCADDHRTASCSSKMYHCIPCGSAGHASWSRDCPTFKLKCLQMDKRLPENSMPYYPTDEEWTQADAPASAVPFGQVNADLESMAVKERRAHQEKGTREWSPTTGANAMPLKPSAPTRYTSSNPGSWFKDTQDLDLNGDRSSSLNYD